MDQGNTLRGAAVGETIGIPRADINLDSYADADAQMGPGLGRISDPCSTPDPRRYHDPSTQVTSIDGATLSSRMPGRFGLRGVIIPRATLYGGSLGCNPEDRVTLTIDPLDPKHSVELDLSRVTPHLAQSALNCVVEKFGPSFDNESARRHHAAACFAASKMIEATAAKENAPMRFGPPAAQPQAPPVAEAPQQFVQQYAQPAQPYPPHAAPGLLAGFSGGQQAATRSTGNGSPGPSQVRVAFDTAMGVHEALYSSVSVQKDRDGTPKFLFLAIDDNSPSKFIPKASDTAFAVYPNGADTVYLVESTGIQVPHMGETIVIFQVISTRPKDL